MTVSLTVKRDGYFSFYTQQTQKHSPLYNYWLCVGRIPHSAGSSIDLVLRNSYLSLFFKSLTIRVAVLWILQLPACFLWGGIQDCMLYINWSTRVKYAMRKSIYTKSVYTVLLFFVHILCGLPTLQSSRWHLEDKV